MLTQEQHQDDFNAWGEITTYGQTGTLIFQTTTEMCGLQVLKKPCKCKINNFNKKFQVNFDWLLHLCNKFLSFPGFWSVSQIYSETLTGPGVLLRQFTESGDKGSCNWFLLPWTNPNNFELFWQAWINILPSMNIYKCPRITHWNKNSITKIVKQGRTCIQQSRH